MTELKITRLFPQNCLTIFDLENWLRCAPTEEQEKWISSLDYSSIMNASIEYDKRIGELVDAGTGGLEDQIHSPLLSALVGAASTWSFLRDGRERPLKDVVRDQLKHSNLI